MKTREGFVSNSSSSSFIVAFPKDMEVTVDNVHNYLFGTTEKLITYYGDPVSSMKAARTVFDDMMDQKPQGMAFGSCHPPVMEDFQDKETLEVDWDGWRQAINDLETLMETTKRFKVDPDKFVNYRFH